MFTTPSNNPVVMQIAPLLYDTMVTFMTVGKAIIIRRRNGGPSSRLIQTFLREGDLTDLFTFFATAEDV